MYKIHNRYLNPNSNFKLVQQISPIKNRPKSTNITQHKYPHANSHIAKFPN